MNDDPFRHANLTPPRAPNGGEDPFLRRVKETIAAWIEMEWATKEEIKNEATALGWSRQRTMRLKEAVLTPHTLAHRMDHLSLGKLIRHLKKLHAPTPGVLIRNARLAHAKTLLTNTRLLVREIGAILGPPGGRIEIVQLVAPADDKPPSPPTSATATSPANPATAKVVAECPGLIESIDVEAQAGKLHPPALVAPTGDGEWSYLAHQDVVLHCHLRAADGAPARQVDVSLPPEANRCVNRDNRFTCFLQ